MSDIQPIFHDIERRAVAATSIEENGLVVLAIEEVHEDGSTSRILTLNQFDAKQLSAACDRYLHQRITTDYSHVHGHLNENDRREAGFNHND